MKIVTKLAIVIMALMLSMSSAFAWSLCVSDPCSDTNTSTGTVAPTSATPNVYVRWDCCPGCIAVVVCKCGNRVLWTRTYRSQGTEEIPQGANCAELTLEVTCKQDPTSAVKCGPRCATMVCIGNPAP